MCEKSKYTESNMNKERIKATENDIIKGDIVTRVSTCTEEYCVKTCFKTDKDRWKLP